MKPVRVPLMAALLLSGCSAPPDPAQDRALFEDPVQREERMGFVLWQQSGQDGRAWVSALVSREGRADCSILVPKGLRQGLATRGATDIESRRRSMALSALEFARLRNLLVSVISPSLEEPRPPEVTDGSIEPRRTWPYTQVRISEARPDGSLRRFVLYRRDPFSVGQAPTIESSPRRELLAIDDFFSSTLKGKFAD